MQTHHVFMTLEEIELDQRQLKNFLQFPCHNQTHDYEIDHYLEKMLSS